MRIAGIDRLLGANKKALLTNTILLANAFIWYLYSFNFLVSDTKTPEFIANYGNHLLPIVAINFLGLFVALLIGEFLSHKMKNRLNFLFLWMSAGIFLSLLPLIGGGTATGGMTLSAAVLFSAITGINFGFGIPLCLGYFASTTDSVNRGKSGGIIFLLIGVGASLILGIGDIIGGMNFLFVSLILAIWRAFGVVALFFAKRSVTPIAAKTKIPYKEILQNRTFLLYFIPWLMFLIVNSLSFPINEGVFGADLVRTSSNVEFVLGGFSAVIFGFFADSKGRKRLAVIGFALLGLGYAVLAFTSLGATEPNYLAWGFYTFVDGITWGSFVMLFVFALWGDIAEGRSGERIYAIAIVPYLLSSLIRLSLGEYLKTIITIENFASTFSFFSFFLFVAVLPLVLAPETLSDQTIKNNELKSYIDKAQKQLSKVKKKQPESKDENNADLESDEQSDETKKAQELAEKYY
jgi:MFS family permease